MAPPYILYKRLRLAPQSGPGSKGSKGKVLKMDGPSAQGFLSLTAFQAEGCGIARRAMSIKLALRDDLAVSYGMIGILQVGSLRSPPPIRLRRTSPYSGGRIKDLEASLRKRQCTLHRQGKDSSLHSYCPTACGGKVVRSTKGGSPGLGGLAGLTLPVPLRHAGNRVT